MRTRLEWSWEVLDENTKRAMVKGGWILSVETKKGSSSTFIPDAHHQWAIKPSAVIQPEEASY